MRILVLSFYFRPDLCAGAFRTTPLVDAIAATMPAGSRLDVVTTMPNRYQSYSVAVPEREQQGNVSIVRIPLPSHRSGMFDQSRAFLSFARRALREASGPYDLVFATSSRLMTAVLGGWIARRARATLYLDIRDIFVETIGDVASPRFTWLFTRLFSLLERFAIRRASTVNLVSRGFAPYFEPRYPRQRFTFFTNGIDEEFLNVTHAPRPDPSHGTPVHVLYAGNLGESQGLHAVLPALAKRLDGRAQFTVVGDGGRRDALAAALDAAEVTNVTLHPPVGRERLLAMYAEADVLFLHLNDYPAFTKVLPSKIFEYAALGRPVWAGLAGHAADFLRREVENSAVFPPCDVDGAVTSFGRLRFGHTPRDAFVKRYSRKAISREMAADILGRIDAGAP
jgi:glycosyltransferase involved in cell wall biosynthesis